MNTESPRENHNEFIKNNKLIAKTQQRFGSERHKVFTKEINKIALRSNGNKRIQEIDSIGTYAYVMGKDLICKKEKTKCNNMMKKCKTWLISSVIR